MVLWRLVLLKSSACHGLVDLTKIYLQVLPVVFTFNFRWIKICTLCMYLECPAIYLKMLSKPETWMDVYSKILYHKHEIETSVYGLFLKISSSESSGFHRMVRIFTSSTRMLWSSRVFLLNPRREERQDWQW